MYDVHTSYMTTRMKQSGGELRTRALAPMVWVAVAAAALLAAGPQVAPSGAGPALPAEKHLGNVRQITFGGQNAEAYFSADDKWLIFQHAGKSVACDQIYLVPTAALLNGPGHANAEGLPPEARLVSTGQGRTTCSYVFPADDKLLFASTHGASAACPEPPDYTKGYVWAVYPSYKIYTAKMDGSDVKVLTNAPGYNAEATITHDGRKIAFTSTRDGDLDIYTMNADG